MAIRVSKTRVDLDDQVLQKPVLRDYGETRVAENSSTSYTIDLTRGNVFEITLTGNCTFTFSNPPASGTAGSFTLFLKQDSTGGRSVTWPASVDWPGGTAPTVANIMLSTDVYSFLTTDGGTTWWGFKSRTGNNLQGLFSWGLNSSGQLGLKHTVNLSSPSKVGPLTTWTKVSTPAGYLHSFAIKADGTLWSWGKNNYGQLGLGDVASRSSPVQIGSLTSWTTIAQGAGRGHVHAIKSDGTLWTWGKNTTYGTLGLGDVVSRSSPVQVGSLTTWTAVASGTWHTLALQSGGTLWSWGANGTAAFGGYLGLGDIVKRSSPVQVGALTTWTAISAAEWHSAALKSDGTLWVFGVNSSGQLGLGDTDSRSSPVQVGALTTWTAVMANGRHNLALKSDGTLWGWGLNDSGQLGLGDTANRSSPVQVGALTTWTTLGTGGATAISSAIKSDGTLWAWGSNSSGSLGLGDTADRSSPVQVGSLTTWTTIARGTTHTLALN